MVTGGAIYTQHVSQQDLLALVSLSQRNIRPDIGIICFLEWEDLLIRLYNEMKWLDMFSMAHIEMKTTSVVHGNGTLQSQGSQVVAVDTLRHVSCLAVDEDSAD